ncbi:MAG: CoA ester lyase [Devosia sp.]|nr:CoA ester lyase [Devosia sp.]
MRSLLYVPAHNERFAAKAHERGADAIILDLEDSVPEADKDRARAALREAVPGTGRNGALVFVRINAGDRAAGDAAAAVDAGAYGLMVPKVQSAAALDVLPDLPLIGLIEDPAAVLDARSIALHRHVIGLALGSEDLATVLSATPNAEVLRFPKLMVHYAAKAAGKLSFGLLRSSADFTDLPAIAAAAQEAREHGFDGATCVHPAIVPVLNRAFASSEDELAWAARVIAAAATAGGAFSLDGRMIDAPVLARARQLISR